MRVMPIDVSGGWEVELGLEIVLGPVFPLLSASLSEARPHSTAALDLHQLNKDCTFFSITIRKYRHEKEEEIKTAFTPHSEIVISNSLVCISPDAKMRS